jgi:polysaccharide export outer membrane protein
MQHVALLLLLSVLVAGGCAGVSPASGPATETASGASAGAVSESGRRWTVAPPPAVSLERRREGDYRLAPKDSIGVQVLGQEELTRTVRVSDAGSVTLPLLDEVPLAGLTLAEAEAKITAGLKGRYLMNPRVTVRVVEYAGRQVSVVGAVGMPGAYPLKSNVTTVLEALAEARGVRENGDRVAYVMRGRPREGEQQPVVIDLDALLRTGDVRHNVVLEGGDTVFVPEANVYYVAGEVEKRGAFPLRRDTTVSKALAEAGGVTKFAATGDIKIIRTQPTGQKEEITGLDLRAVMSGERNQDLPLQAQDMVVIPMSGGKAVAYGVVDFLKGLFSFAIMPGL